MKIGIFLNGKYGKIDFYINEIEKLDYIVGVDGGNNLLKEMGRKPDLSIGDFDSIFPQTLNWLSKSRILQFPKHKNQSDAYLALQEVQNLNPKEIYVFGGLGKRWDHTYSNILLLSKFDFMFKEKDVEIFSIKDSKEHIYNCKKNETWSLLPLKDIQGLKITGFRYKANNLDMNITNPIGLSNITTSNKVTITLSKGILVVFRNLIP